MSKVFKNVKRLKLKITSIVLLVALLMLEFSPLAVKATAQQLQYYSPGVTRVAWDSNNSKFVWYSNATLGGETAYCIDYSYSAPSGTMTFSRYLSDQGMAVLMHGYPNCTPESIGCQSADEAYMATQMAFWEVIERTGESKKTRRVFRVDAVTPISGKEDFYNRAKAAAEKLVAMAEADPYTSVPTMTIDNSSVALHDLNGEALIGPYTVTISGTDASTIKSITATLENAPASAKVTDANGNEKTSLSNGDTVYVKMDKSEDSTNFKIKFHADVDRKVGAIYSTNDSYSQDYVKIETEPNTIDKELTIEWETVTTIGEIKLVKNDQEGEPVAGAKFELKDSTGKSLGTVETGDDGTVKFYKVPEGTYTLEEIEAPQGYTITEKSKNVTVKGGETTEVEFVNERITGRLVITKVDDANKPIANVTFEIKDNKDNVVATLTTDENGKASINLDYGTYYFTETHAPEGYIMDTKTYALTVDAENRTYNKTITNERCKGNLLIVKTDEEETPIEGVKFDILDSDKNKVLTITTNEKGLAGALNLPVGTYYYQEVYAPENVEMDNGVYEFKIETEGQIVRKDIVNYKIKGSLKVTKVDENNTPIAGVKFNILDEQKNVVDTITTNENGIAVSKELTPGTYYYKETEVPSSKYVLDSTENKFEITNEAKLVPVTVVNKFAKGTLQITKLDSNNTPLSGVEFDILDESKNVVDHITTDDEGKASSKELPLGTYYYKETKAPENVVMDQDEHKFVLTENNMVVQKTVVNDVKKGSLKIIKVDENNKPLEGVTFDIYDADKNKIDTIVTNSEGIAESKELEKGKYYYQETKAPEGIVVDSTMYEFEIVEDGQNVIKNMINYYAKGQLKIYKLIDGTQTPLAGAEFEITNEAGEVVDTITSGEDGVALSKKLPFGTYYFKETKAPDGYIKDENTYTFKVESDNQVLETVIYNTEERLPKTGGLLSADLMIVLAVALVSISGYGLVKVLSNNK